MGNYWIDNRISWKNISFFMERQNKKYFQQIYYITGVKSAIGQKSWGNCGIKERSLD